MKCTMDRGYLTVVIILDKLVGGFNSALTHTV